MQTSPPPTFLWNHVSMKLLEVSLSCLHFSRMFSEGEVKSPFALQVYSCFVFVLLLLLLFFLYLLILDYYFSILP
jgi:hypothetical protein